MAPERIDGLSRWTSPIPKARRKKLMDAESQAWVRDLRSKGPVHDRTVARLHELLLRVAYSEATRRRTRVPEAIHSELDDLCLQAASDAVMAIIRKLDTFQGRARFTTWACKFVILEFSTSLRRRMWRGRNVEPDETAWERLADSAPTALQGLEQTELLAALGQAVRENLTDRQRLVFQSAVMDDVPIDVLAERLQSSRGAVYKTLHDARRKLRASLTEAGYVGGTAR